MQVLDFRVHEGGRCGGFPKLGVAKNTDTFSGVPIIGMVVFTGLCRGSRYFWQIRSENYQGYGPCLGPSPKGIMILTTLYTGCSQNYGPLLVTDYITHLNS